MAEMIKEAPGQVYFGMGKFLRERLPSAHARKIMETYDEKIIPKLHGKAQEIALKLRPAFAQYAKLAGLSQTAMEVQLAAAAVVGVAFLGKTAWDSGMLEKLFATGKKTPDVPHETGESIRGKLRKPPPQDTKPAIPVEKRKPVKKKASPTSQPGLRRAAEKSSDYDVLMEKVTEQIRTALAQGKPYRYPESGGKALSEGKVAVIDGPKHGDTIIVVNENRQIDHTLSPPHDLKVLFVNDSSREVTEIAFYQYSRASAVSSYAMKDLEIFWEEFLQGLRMGNPGISKFAGTNKFKPADKAQLGQVLDILRLGTQNSELQSRIANYCSNNPLL